MPDSFVIDTGPLITLARIEALDVIGRLAFDFVCPPEVRAELQRGEDAGHIHADPGWLRVISLHQAPSPLAIAALDHGEAAVIQLALEQRIAWVCIDERKARRAALAVGLKVTGTLGLLGLAKLRGLIPALRPLVEKASDKGIHYHPELLKQVLRAVGE